MVWSNVNGTSGTSAADREVVESILKEYLTVIDEVFGITFSQEESKHDSLVLNY